MNEKKLNVLKGKGCDEICQFTIKPNKQTKTRNKNKNKQTKRKGSARKEKALNTHPSRFVVHCPFNRDSSAVHSSGSPLLLR